MKIKHTLWLAPVALALPAWLIVGHAHAKGEETAPALPFVNDHGTLRIPEGSPLRKRVQVDAVTATAVAHRVTLPGQIEANPAHTVNILPPLSGRVVGLKVALGDAVKAGQVLAVIASGDMAQAYADFDKAHDALELAKKTRDRTRGVEKAGAAAIKDIETAESGYTQAETEYTRARTRLEALGGRPGAKVGAQQIVIAAPSDGFVTALNVGQGSMVNDLTATMMTVSDLSNIWVTANVPENLVSTIHRGDDADVSLPAYGGETLHGKVTSMSTVLSPDTRRLPIRIAFANPKGRLLPNMYASVSVAAPQEAQVLIPQSALLMNNDSTTVLIEVAPWTFARRAVELGYDEGGMARVISGLKAGERVVTKGGVLLND